MKNTDKEVFFLSILVPNIHFIEIYPITNFAAFNSASVHQSNMTQLFANFETTEMVFIGTFEGAQGHLPLVESSHLASKNYRKFRKRPHYSDPPVSMRCLRDQSQ